MAEDPIICDVTKWYFKRMSLMSLMFIGFGLYFFYDGLIGYPKKNRIFLAHEAFEEVMTQRDEYLKTASDSEWADYAAANNLPSEGTWREFAAKQNWPEKPPEKLHSTTDQFVCGGICVAVGLIILTTMLLNRKRRLTADASSLTTPEGIQVPFASAFRIDKRKWDNKGLCYVFYRTDNGKEKRAVIDDLKFGGATKVLDRLLSQFEGELIERVSEESPAVDS